MGAGGRHPRAPGVKLSNSDCEIAGIDDQAVMQSHPVPDSDAPTGTSEALWEPAMPPYWAMLGIITYFVGCSSSRRGYIFKVSSTTTLDSYTKALVSDTTRLRVALTRSSGKKRKSRRAYIKHSGGVRRLDDAVLLLL